MFSFSPKKAIVLVGAAGQFQNPQLVFHPVASDQPQIVEGVPAWHDKVLVQGDTVVVRHLRYQPVYYSLSASLRVSRDTLKVVVSMSPPHGEGGVPPGGFERAYEARIGPLQSGKYVLILNDVGRPSERPVLRVRPIVIP
jgi:hypothetical protein